MDGILGQGEWGEELYSVGPAQEEVWGEWEGAEGGDASVVEISF